MVRTSLNAGDSTQLHHIGDVPALCRRCLRHEQVQNTAGKIIFQLTDSIK